MNEWGESFVYDTEDSRDLEKITMLQCISLDDNAVLIMHPTKQKQNTKTARTKHFPNKSA